MLHNGQVHKLFSISEIWEWEAILVWLKMCVMADYYSHPIKSHWLAGHVNKHYEFKIICTLTEVCLNVTVNLCPTRSFVEHYLALH